MSSFDIGSNNYHLYLVSALFYGGLKTNLMWLALSDDTHIKTLLFSQINPFAVVRNHIIWHDAVRY